MAACANPVPPSGGPKDETPPMVDSELSTSNQQVNFKERTFTLVFDEWVKLDNIHQQMIVSPPIKYKPEVNLKGKELTFTFDPRDTLIDNTTYSIQFGDGIKDLNEGNAAENLKFVFSTGPIIDSLSVAGKILDVLSEEAAKEMKVMLYDGFQDSLPLLERPQYVAKTNDAGAFKFENLRSDTFRLIAILDEDNNYLFSPGKEKVAFLDTLLVVNKNLFNINLLAFDEVTKPKLSKKELQADRLTIGFDQIVDTSSITILSSDVRDVEVLQDSIIYWLDGRLDSIRLITNYKNTYDTTLIRKARKARKDTTHIRLIKGKMTSPVSSENDPLRMIFNRSIVQVDTSKIAVSDSSKSYNFIVETNTDRSLHIKSQWIHGREITVKMAPEALMAINGKSHQDTIEYAFFVPKKESLGKLTFTIDSLHSDPPRVVQVLLKEKIVRQFIVRPNRGEQTFEFSNLPAGKYELLIVEDRNENGKWDTGNYLDFIQPEPRIRKILEPLRENWDLNVNLQLN